MSARKPWHDEYPAGFGEDVGLSPELAGAWFAQPPMRFGHELIAAGLLLSGPTNRDQLEHWLRVGWERSRGSCSPTIPAMAGTDYSLSLSRQPTRTADLLELTGMDYAEARDLTPEMD